MAVLALLGFAVAGIGLWWAGAAVQRLAGAPSDNAAVSVGVGLAVVVVAGGVLNVARLAYAPVLLALAGAICLAGLVALWKRRGALRVRRTLGRWEAVELVGAAVLLLAMGLFAVETQFPPAAFNVFDDLHKYFTHPVRMLATGTVASGPMSVVGATVLGGQAFLQAIFLALLPIEYINGADAVLGLLALASLAASLAFRLAARIPFAILGAALVLVVNPRYANITGLYSGATLVATAVVLGTYQRPSALLLGLVYAGAVAIKSSFVVFVAAHLLLSMIACGYSARAWAGAISWACRTALVGAGGLLPWVAVSAGAYLGRSSASFETPARAPEWVNIFSPEPLSFGDTWLQYTSLGALAVVLGAAALVSARGSRDLRELQRAAGALAGAAAGLAAYLVSVLLLAGSVDGALTGLRLSVPSLLGACIPAILLSARSSGTRRLDATAGLGLLLAASFLPSAITRWRQAAVAGTSLAFSSVATSANWLRQSQVELSEEKAARIRNLQGRVPPSVPLLTWIGSSFRLDFRRNEIINVEYGGTTFPWSRIPAEVRYVLWEYAGESAWTPQMYRRYLQAPGGRTRRISVEALALGAQLEQLSRRGRTLADDGQFLLFQLRDGDDFGAWTAVR